MGFNIGKVFKKVVKKTVGEVASGAEDIGDGIKSGAKSIEDDLLEKMAKDFKREGARALGIEALSADGTPLNEGDQDIKLKVVSDEVKERNQELQDLKDSNERSRQQAENQERAMIQSMIRSSQSGSSQGSILGDALGSDNSQAPGGRFKGKSLLGE